MQVRHYRDLLVWQKAMILAKSIYETSASFPKEDKYGLISQIRRSAVSIPSNIAEGHNRDSLKDYLRFLSIAQGSLAELETQISLAAIVKYIDVTIEDKLLTQADEIGKMMRGLQRKLKAKLLEPSPLEPSPLELEPSPLELEPSYLEPSYLKPRT